MRIKVTTEFSYDITTTDGVEEDENENEMTGKLYQFVIILYACIFVIGVIGNSLVVTVIAKDKSMRSVANLFLVSLSVADLMIILFCLPIAAYEVYNQDWPFGSFLCKLMPYLQYVSVNASVLTILAISFERLLIIVLPLNARSYCTKRRSFYVIVLIWLLCFATSSPTFLISRLTINESTTTTSLGDNNEQINSTVSVTHCFNPTVGYEWYYVTQTTAFYLFPGVALFIIYAFIIRALANPLTVSYDSPPSSSSARQNASKSEIRRFSRSRESRRQVIYLLGSVVLAYFLCLLPYNIVVIISVMSPETLYFMDFDHYSLTISTARVLFFINSCINPILYNAISSKFRLAFLKLFRFKKFIDWRRKSVYANSDRKSLKSSTQRRRL